MIDQPLEETTATGSRFRSRLLHANAVQFRLERVRWICLALILAVAAVLRFYCLSCSSMWHDEGNTWAMVDRAFTQIARDAAADIHPPGYYWLLKSWTLIFGTSVAGIRSFSAAMGLTAVAVTYAVGRRVVQNRWIPLVAAFLAAINPFQIYFSQEGRMYALLMLESLLLFWALFQWMGKGRDIETNLDRQTVPDITSRPPFLPGRRSIPLAYFLAAVAGLWTHYIFPVVIVAAAAGYAWHVWRIWRNAPRSSMARPLIGFAGVNICVFLTYLPWLPTATSSVLNWPASGQSSNLLHELQLVLHTLLLGPIRSAPALPMPLLLLAGILPILGLWLVQDSSMKGSLGLWLLAPIGTMAVFDLFTDSFLKFLLVSSPAWCLLTAATLTGSNRWQRAAFWPLLAGILAAAVGLSVASLPAYYNNPAARDNYKGIARTVDALGDPASGLVLLNAPGQREVWDYYDPGLPVLALPGERPPDVEATRAMLAAAAAGREQIFALFWASEQSDPERIVESWLDQHAFKGLESWQGNVRFVTYVLPNNLTCRELTPSARVGSQIFLNEVCMPPRTTVNAGENIPLQLRWQTATTIDRRYKVTLQLLDDRDQVVAQRDSEPAGGTEPTSGWQPGDVIEDNHAVFIPIGTPPLRYRLVLGMYDAGNAGDPQARLAIDGDSLLDLGTVTVRRPQRTVPSSILPIRYRSKVRAAGVELVGYDFHRKGFAHDPAVPVESGDLVHVILYWQNAAGDGELPSDMSFDLYLGGQTLTAPLAGGAYPTDDWQPGEYVRAEFDLPYDGTESRLRLQVGGNEFHLGDVPTG